MYDNMPLKDWKAKTGEVRISQGREMENVQQHISGGVNKRVMSMLFPIVGDIIEVDEGNTNAKEDVSVRDLLFKEKQMQADEQQKRENVIVTSGGLIFLAIAALLVTAAFLMSPVIGNIFSKYRISSSTAQTYSDVQVKRKT